MNWTEGSLARYARGRSGKETVLKQKEHFAKARSAAASKPETARGALYSIAVGDRVSGSKTSGQSTSSVRGKDRIASRFWASETDQENGRPSTYSKRKRDGPGAEETFAEKRRKLLAKSDWVGLKIQKPVEVDFAADEPTTRNEKWSKVKSRDVNARARNYGIGDRYGAERFGTFAEQLDRLDRDQVKVTVGSEYMWLGDGSTVWRHAGGGSSSAGCSHSRCSRDENESYARRSKRRSSSYRDEPSSSIGRTRRSDREKRHNRHTSIETPPSILQPKPKRQILADILSHESPQSEATASNIAQLGLSIECVSPTQELQNQQWKANRGFEGTSRIDEDASSRHARARISPGMMVEHRSPPKDISFGQPEVSANMDRIGDEAIVKLLEMRNNRPLIGRDNPGLTQPTSQISDSCNVNTQGLASARAGMPARVEPVEDPNEAWRQFVFADDEENLTEGILHETAGEIYGKQFPQLTSPIHCQSSVYDPVNELATNARTDLATVGSDDSRDVPLRFETQYRKESSCTVARLSSSSATVGAPYSQPNQLHGGATVSPSFGSQAGRTERASPERWSDWVSLLVLPPISEAAESTREESFRFAPPKLFVGKNAGPAGTSSWMHWPEPPAPRRRDPRRGRRAARRSSGRLDIAKLPNYSGDPIEEFSDEVFWHQSKSSLFGALEME